MEVLVGDHLELVVPTDDKKEPQKYGWYPSQEALDPVQRLLVLGDGKKVLLVRSRGVVQLLNYKGEILGYIRVETLADCLCARLMQDEAVCLVFSDGLLAHIQFNDHDNISVGLVWRLEEAKEIQAAAYLDGLLAVAGKDAPPLLYDLRQSKPELIWRAPKPRPDKLGIPVKVDIRSIVWLSEGRLVCGTAKGTASIYSIKSNAQAVEKPSLTLNSSAISCFKVGENQEKLFVGSLGGSLKSVSLPDFKEIGGYGDASGSVVDIVYSSNWLISASLDRFIRIYDMASRKLVHKIFLSHTPRSLAILRMPVITNGKDDNDVWASMVRVGSKKAEN